MITAQHVLKEWRDNPLRFAWDNFKFEPDRWQKNTFKKIARRPHGRVAMKACAGPGKTAMLAIEGLRRLSCYGGSIKGDHPKGAAVSMTKDNLRDNLWSELAHWMNKSEYLSRTFKWTKTRISSRRHPETWWMSARTWSRSATAEEQGRTLSGLHSPNIFVLMDEFGDIPPEVLKAAKQSESNCRTSLLMGAGNPTSHDGILYMIDTKERHLWDIIRITADPNDSDRTPRVSKEWAQEQIDTYGYEDVWVMSYILGLFPPTSLNSLLSPEEVDIAMTRIYKPAAFEFSQKRLMVDVARYGDDMTVGFPRQGVQALMPYEQRGADGPEIAARLALAIERWNPEIYGIDCSGGWGASAYDAAIQAAMTPLWIDFAGKADEPKFYNKRSEMWFRMAHWVKKRGSLPNVPKLAGDLTVPRYTVKNGRFLIEPKDMIKKRLKRSPDHGDALAMTFYTAEAPAGSFRPALPPGTPRRGQDANRAMRHVSDWDPMDDE